MDEQQNVPSRPVNPRRRPRSKFQIFKEAYLPVIIAGAAVLLILIFVIGSIVRAVQRGNAEQAASQQAASQQAAEEARLAQEQTRLLEEAAVFAQNYYYDNAISVLKTFSGDMSKYPTLSLKLAEYQAAQNAMVAWDDPTKVPNLSFHLLMADPQRAFAHEEYGTAFNKNYLTTTEVSRMLQQLYDNGYVLVSMDDLFTVSKDVYGTTVLTQKTLYQPEGKKPIMLTQTNVNYNIYMVDSEEDEDLLPDKDGAGFANRLILDENGKFTCQMVDSSGNTVTGAYDLVPILEAFVEEHPDFSYRGAKATLALSGYNGVFGYRTYSGADSDFGADAYQSDLAEAKKVAAALIESGYELACYTYNNRGYGNYNTDVVKEDVQKWISETKDILGTVDTLVYAQNSDIAPAGVYSGDKYKVLRDAGFCFYLGFCENGQNWTTVANEYARMGRILVNGTNLAYHAQWFTGIFDAAQVLDSAARGTVPN